MDQIEAAEHACSECVEKDRRIEEVGRHLEEATKRIGALEAEVADLMPAAQRGNTWIYKSGPEYLKWLKAIAEITNEEGEGFHSGQRVLRRVEELSADRDGLLALVHELSNRLDE